jgi:hypothetical protein
MEKMKDFYVVNDEFLQKLQDVHGVPLEVVKANTRNVKEIYEIDWFNPDCEVCGQGALLCRNPKCPSNRCDHCSVSARMDRLMNRTRAQRLVAAILNRDED